MNKPQLLKAIYTELRASVGSDVSAGDLLRLANHILQSYIDDTAGMPVHLEGNPERSLWGMPVDRAMQEGGWRLYNHEISSHNRDDLTAGEQNRLRAKIEKHLGPEWQQILLTDQL